MMIDDLNNTMDESITQTALTSQRYNELCSQLDVSLPEVHSQCDSFLSSLTADDDESLAHPSERLEALVEFSGGFDSQKQDVAELLVCGKYLIAILDLLDCSDTPKAQEIHCRLEKTTQQLEHIINALETKHSELSVEVARFAEAEAEIENIVTWLEAADIWRVSSGPVSLSEQNLSRQIEIEKCQKDEAVKWQKHVGEVTARCQELRMAPVKYAGLLERCDSIVMSAAERIEHLEEMMKRIEHLQRNADDLNCWISDTASLLTKRSSSVENFTEQQTFIENLSNQWRLKRQELEELLESAATLHTAELSLDLTPVHQLFTEIESDFCHVSESFVNYVSAQVCQLVSLT